jgi:hypothetical protein
MEFSAAIAKPTYNWARPRFNGLWNISYPSVLSSSPALWAIPTEVELDDMEASCPPDAYNTQNDDRLDFRFSAAAVAIQFLQSIPPSTRFCVRKIILKEDRKSSAYSECHGRGLISFCIENPLLRVERRVNIWRTVFVPRLRSARFERAWIYRDDPEDFESLHEKSSWDAVVDLSR